MYILSVFSNFFVRFALYFFELIIRFDERNLKNYVKKKKRLKTKNYQTTSIIDCFSEFHSQSL